MKTLLFSLIVAGFAATVFADGLGERFADFERQWNKGYRQEVPIAGGVFKDVRVGYGKDRSIAYTIGSNDFDGRIGTIHGETRGMFGAAENRLPTTHQFLSGIKAMMPADSKLGAKYASSEGGRLIEVYLFKSASLSKLPGIEKSSAYGQDAKSVGKFTLTVNHRGDDHRYILNYTLSLGSGESDIHGMKKVKAVMK